MVFGPVPNRPYHEAFMRKAIDMAELALASDETPVGCVFVHKGEIIGRGINGTNASLNVLNPPPRSSHSSLISRRAPDTPNSSPSPKSWPNTRSPS
jgi:tRNA(Arg) A34 adenosine deaminase TadA